MPGEERERVYSKENKFFIPQRLFSFFEIQPGRFAHSQWKWIGENLFMSRRKRP
jgi:hypothetical protein